ncbi:MAG: tetratricopeptide repeat protein, partial [Planctomycetaceae bacterium]|nr:tetratricopeptide repeat protein [Planctomycetaceae bacterium]
VASDAATWSAIYTAAMSSLAVENTSRYRVACQRMLATFHESEDISACHFTAWTCALGPEAVEDFVPAIAAGRKAVAQQPENQQYLNGLGGVLLRAGDFDEARTVLLQALQTRSSETTSLAYTHYFLAMAAHHLGDREDTRKHLEQAKAITDTELASAQSWNRKLTLKILQKEAEELLTQ